MTPEQFTYWLQGFMEMADPKELNETQTQQIKDHLKLVFDKKTPDRISGTGLVNPPYSLPGIQWNPNPYTIECDHNLPDPMTTQICSTTTLNTTSLDPDIKRVMNEFGSTYKNESKRARFDGPKC